MGLVTRSGPCDVGDGMDELDSHEIGAALTVSSSDIRTLGLHLLAADLMFYEAGKN